MAYNYNSSDPIAISLKQLTDREKYLLTESKTFCMYPWIHLHSYPTGDAYPCCHAEMPEKLGNCQQQSMKEIWSGDKMKQLRDDMLNERENPACTRCYEQEKSGFFSGRKSANKHHGHHIKKGIDLDPPFEMTYWDIRFSNLCNLSCRSCGHIFSSSWYQDQKSLAGEGWGKNNKPLFWAGRHETDMLEQLMEHIDCVEQIYFAGGEPLMMDEHYHILEELERREKFNVRLIYNTNFTKTKLKDRYVFDYWRKFRSVAVGASLDAMGPRAEYIRKGTDWSEVESNRQMMIEQCPNVDFYISPTMSIQNALHIPDFHRDWVERGYIQPQDLNVNILQDPKWLRIDIAPESYKEKLRVKFKEHLEWLRPLDKLNRATVGFESALNFLETDNSQYLPEFWERMTKLDELRNENLLEVIPELDEIRIDN
jgi:radical SAM protein with 4Fe4S-binding SPASM domain